THFGHRAHAVVGHAVDDDRGATDAVAFVADLFVVDALEVAGGLVDVLLDRVGGHVGSLRLVDGQAQPRVHVRVAAALAGRDHDLVNDACPDLAALLILATFAVLNVGPFGMTGHDSPFDRLRFYLSPREQ